MNFNIIEGNIVYAPVDAVVNAANAALLPGSGVCGAIYEAAGYGDLRVACDALRHCPTGSAVMTDGFNLRAKKIIHAVGPIWHGGRENEEGKLRGAYRSALNLAKENGLKSIAFPLISAGIYGYPRKKAFIIACEELEQFAAANPDIAVYLYLLYKEEFL